MKKDKLIVNVYYADSIDAIDKNTFIGYGYEVISGNTSNSEDEKVVSIFNDLTILIRVLKNKIDTYFNYKGVSAHIILESPASIKITKDKRIMRCTAFSIKEQNNFWKKFNNK